jgi:hypothetical protein
MAKCGKCGTEFDAKDAVGRDPCPACGGDTRILDDSAIFEVKVQDHVMLELARNGQTVGFSESERDGISTSADDQGGCVTTTVVGGSPKGEADRLRVSRTLIQKMNQLGESWNDPIEWPEQHSHIDCFATKANDENETLYIQVVRPIDEPWWRELAKAKTNTASGTPEEWAGIILQVAEKKRDRNSPEQRARLILAIDANRLAALTFASVAKSIREKHGDAFASMGFRAIWLVGPSASMTHRLDANSDVR